MQSPELDIAQSNSKSWRFKPVRNKQLPVLEVVLQS